jgi:diguanylate cyclase (GGDEF)-like protein
LSRRRSSRSDSVLGGARSSLADLSPVALIGYDGAGRIVSWSRAATVLLDWTPTDAVGRHVTEIFGRDAPLGVGVERVRTRAVTPFGSTVDVEMLSDGSISATGLGSGVFAAISTGRTEAARIVADGSPRVHNWAEAGSAIQEVGGVVQCSTVGLIGVKAVNRGYSRSTGDAVLREVLVRLTRLAGERGRALRIAGTQFLVVSPQADRLDGERIVIEMARPIETALGPVRIASCVGTSTGESVSAYVLLDQADASIGRAISRGVGAVDRAPREGDAPESRHPRLSSLLIDAVARREIGVEFQPVVDVVTGAVVEYEALARWTSAELGEVDPVLFIEAAEDAGLIHELGRCVLDAALDAVVQVRGAGQWGDARVSVNLSAVQLAHPDLVRRLSQALSKRSLTGSVLQLELTETRPISTTGEAAANLRAVRELGVRVAVDDFGTGCANMSYLRDLPVDAIKIDQRFIAGVSTCRADAAVIRSIISVANDLRLDVIAEGVETIDQHFALVRLGCPAAQGFLYASPRPAEQLHLAVELPHVDRSTAVPFPVDEIGRLGALHAADVLDTPSEPAYDQIVHEAAAMCGTPIALVSLVDADHQWAKARIGDVADHTAREISFCAHAICTDELTEVADTTTDDRFRANPLVTGDPGIRFYAAAPLHNSSGHNYGTVCVMDVEPRTLTDTQRAGLIQLAQRATTMIELREQTRHAHRAVTELAFALDERDAAQAALAHRADHDPLTGLANRAEFMARLEASLDTARANATSVTVLMCDVDQLKLINDTLGHSVGDRILHEIATRIQSCVRHTETVARIGGDEFAVLAPRAEQAVVSALTRRILDLVSQPFTISGLADVHPSVSIGIATSTEQSDSDRMLLDADTAVARAKRLGGGQAVTFDREPFDPTREHPRSHPAVITWAESAST